MADTYTVTEARAHLGEVVNKARHGGKVIQITPTATANSASGSRAANWTSPIAIAGQPRKLKARV